MTGNRLFTLTRMCTLEMRHSGTRWGLERQEAGEEQEGSPAPVRPDSATIHVSATQDMDVFDLTSPQFIDFFEQIKLKFSHIAS